jgi:N-acetylglucosaminyl-diphospho-decaprenol L-rhamnosyltransferase
MDLSIIIVNWNTRDFLTQCLRSLQAAANHSSPTAQSLTFGNYTTEVLVVDNGSTDGSAAIVIDNFAWAKLISNDRNYGFAPANNQAIRLSTGRYILLLNSDTEVRSSAVEALVSFMDAKPTAGAAGAYLLNADGSLQPSCQPMLTPWREFWRLTFLDRVWQCATYPMRHWDTATDHRVEVIKGACLIVRRAALDQVGLLDEQYFFYTEEVDLCYRLLHDGWTLHWVPQARVVHHGEASSKQMAEAMYVQLYRSKVQFYRKTGGERDAGRFKRLVALAYWPRFVLATLAKPIAPQLSLQARTFRRLLNELPRM